MTAPAEQVFTLPYPPSLNNLYVNAGSRGRVRSQKYAEWATAAGWELKAQRPRHILDDCQVLIEVRRPNRRADVDGKCKAVLDLMTGLVWADDSQVIDLRVRWAPVDGCRVTVRVVEAAE